MPETRVENLVQLLSEPLRLAARTQPENVHRAIFVDFLAALALLSALHVLVLHAQVQP